MESERLLRSILSETGKLDAKLDRVEEGLTRLSVTLDHNRQSVEHLERIVWRADGDKKTLSEGFVEQSARIDGLVQTIGRVESDIKVELSDMSARIDGKNGVLFTIGITVLAALLGFVGNYAIEHASPNGSYRAK